MEAGLCDMDDGPGSSEDHSHACMLACICCWAGKTTFMTMVLPPASAGPSFQACITSGKFLRYHHQSRQLQTGPQCCCFSQCVPAQGGTRKARGQRPSSISMLSDCCQGCVDWPILSLGKYNPHHGMIWPTTPIGSFRVYTCSLPSVGIVWPARKKEDCFHHCTRCFLDALSMTLE